MRVSDSLDYTKLSDAELIARTKAAMAKLGIAGDVHLRPLIEGEVIEVDIEDEPPTRQSRI